VLRVFDQPTAEEFYLDYLGFVTDWEHRFGPDFPRYAQISRSDLIIHSPAARGPNPSITVTAHPAASCSCRCRESASTMAKSPRAITDSRIPG
jgi:hypothetical protein